MAETNPTIPVVDVGKLTSLDFSGASSDGPPAALTETAKELCDAFRNVGFVYIKNHGIPEELVNTVRKLNRDFFEIPFETKKRYLRQGQEVHGYIPLESESLNPDRPGDLKEAYNVTPDTAKSWPDDVIPGFKNSVLSFYCKAELLGIRILQAIAFGLGLTDTDYFASRHSQWPDCKGSLTTLRVLHYPALGKRDVRKGQVRCGEHSDYGSITLLFQDDVGGLEVKTSEGHYVEAPPIPGTILVNIGDQMQRWTSDLLKSTEHRVLIPEGEIKRNQSRMSMAFFLMAKQDAVVSCIDGSDKYPPITSLDYINMRFGLTFHEVS